MSNFIGATPSSRRLKPIGIVRGFNEAEVDFNMYNICKAIHFGNTMAASCRSYVLDSLFQLEMQFIWKGRSIKASSEFRDLLNYSWNPFGKACYDEICLAGIIPVKFSKIKGGKDKVPVVVAGNMGRDYRILVRTNLNTGQKEFTYWRLVDKKTGMPITPTYDPKVIILSGFGFDPMPNGKLTSPVASIVRQDYFQDRMIQYTLAAEHNRSNPAIFTEIAVESTGAIRPEMLYDYYADGDRNANEAARKYQLNAQEIAAVIESKRILQEQQYQDQETTSMGEPLIDTFNQQGINNIRPLPVGHKLAKQTVPTARTDWTEMNRHVEGLICLAYKVPRAMLMADVAMSETGVRITEGTMYNNINNWKTILSQIYTNVYRCLYHEEDMSFLIDMHNEQSDEQMTEDDLFVKVMEPRVTVKIPIIPRDTPEGLLQKYSTGVLSWEKYVRYSKLIAGYPVDEDEEDEMAAKTDGMGSRFNMNDKRKSDGSSNADKKNKNGTSNDNSEDPWNQEFKLSLARSVNGSTLNQLGLVSDYMFGPKPKNVFGEEKDENGEENSKTKDAKKDKKKTPAKKSDDGDDDNSNKRKSKDAESTDKPKKKKEQEKKKQKK